MTSSTSSHSERGETHSADVIVVGGGPAGLSAAEAAARGGATVILLERQKEIGYPIHTSGGSWISDMRALEIPERLYFPIRTVVFQSPNRKVAFEYPDPVCCVIDIRGVYQHLAGRAVVRWSRDSSQLAGRAADCRGWARRRRRRQGPPQPRRASGARRS